MSAQTQTVFRLVRRTGVDNIQEFQEPIPTPLAHEVLIKIRSASLNYRDVAIATSTYGMPIPDGIVPAADMAGEVVGLGPGVGDFALGDRVTAPVNPAQLYGPFKNGENAIGGPRDGVLRQYMTLPATGLVKLPESPHTFNDWAASVSTALTIWNVFYGGVPMKAGDTVLLLGTGGVSLTGLVFAKAAGITTIITSSSDEKLEIAKKYGADYTINYKTTPDWAAEVQRITGGRGVDHVLEVGGVGTLTQSFGSVAIGGTVDMIGFLTSVLQDEMPNVAMMALWKGVTLRGILAGSKQLLEEAVQFMGRRRVKVPIDKVFKFTRDDIVVALRYVEAGTAVGKVVIEIQ